MVGETAGDQDAWDFLDEGEDTDERRAEVELVKSLLAKCESEDITAEVEGDGIGVFAMLELPSGRKKRQIYTGCDRVPGLLALPLKEIVLLGRLQAVCNYASDTIDAYVASANGRNASGLLRRRLRRVQADERDPLFQFEQGDVQITLGPPSNELRAVLGPHALSSGRLAIRISGLGVTRQEDATVLLERLADALFFEVDSELGVPLVLEKGRYLGDRWRRRSKSPTLKFPTSEYDADPMALYWYGRGATNMPLLRFLAFYQVLEFYFPVFAEEVVRRRVKGVVKDPSFNAHDEQEISRILRAMRLSGSRGGLDERSQLRAVVKACGDPDLIRDLLSMNQQRGEYFVRKKGGPARQVLRPEMSDEDLLDAVSERVYEIRCRIVHTKDSNADEERLLPFSQEADGLLPDIELVEDLARAALVASSRSLKLTL